MRHTATINSKGQIVIPSAPRKLHGLHEGTTVVFQEVEGRLTLDPKRCTALGALRGSLRRLPLKEELQELTATECEGEDKNLKEVDPLFCPCRNLTFGEADEYLRKLCEHY